ncbi:class I SAM-dependent methyltransferase [Nevskia sp.]|uniref:class I SAM-dependent methyltransferase n=1 Tax=Nevskia sp. TaxID=1929292 RepID=UPI0025F0CBDD|nr:class I SAM-dependent methyltransferase [Nevskia sp.]
MADPYDNYAENHLRRISTTRTRTSKQQAFLENYSDALPVDKSASILEIGPGLGETAELLVEKLGYSGYSAIDISKDIVALFSEKPEYRVSQVDDPIAYIESQRGQYRLILLLHVLEHVPRHLVVPLLKACHQALTPDGELVVEVPNVANPYVGSAFAFGDFTHETAFTSTSLREVFGSAGFDPVRVVPVRVPLVSISRRIQHFLQALFISIHRLIANIYMPSSVPLLSHFIAARGKKRNQK